MKETGTIKMLSKNTCTFARLFSRLTFYCSLKRLSRGGQGQEQVKAHGDYPDRKVSLPCKAVPVMYNTEWPTPVSLESCVSDRSRFSSAS